MVKRLFLSLLLLAVAFVSVRCQSSQPHNSVHDEIDSLRKEYDNIGLAVVVVKEGRVVYSETFGHNPDPADPTKGTPIRKDDLFYIASVSKTFVGTAIMQLVEKGKLSLDDDVNKHLDFSLRNPRFPDKPITIRMLLAHRSSLAKGAPYDDFDKINPGKAGNIQTFFKDCPPDAKYEYSNLGFVILGAVIEKVSGKRFDVYVQENILNPLKIYGGYDVSKLDSTKFVYSCKYNAKKDCYDVNKKHFVADTIKLSHYRLGYSTPILNPAGGLKISAVDLAKYMIVHMNWGQYSSQCRILSKESEREMRERQNKTLFGLSFVHFKKIIPNEVLVGMKGSRYGMHTSMYFHPKKEYGFVIFCNGCNSKDIALNNEVIRVLYKTFVN
ncbi:MAG: serine hydrolase [Bacteroidales bacterium]|nr:serine hydrolase [Bacteroidales bacterium]